MNIEIRSEIKGLEVVNLICNELKKVPILSDIEAKDIMLKIQKENNEWEILDLQKIKFTYNK